MRRLDEKNITSFVDGLTSITPRNRNLIVIYVGHGTSEIAKFCFKSDLNSDFNLLLGKIVTGVLEFRI